MFCSTCGVAVPDSLSYCNHCGARLSTPNSDKVATSRQVSPELIVGAMVTIFIFGLLAMAVLLGVMKTALNLELGQILAFAVLSFLLLVSIEGVFVLLLFRRNREAKEPATKELEKHATKELAEPQVQALREPLTSVTDHTTRAFEPLYPNQKKTT